MQNRRQMNRKKKAAEEDEEHYNEIKIKKVEENEKDKET